MAKGSNSNVTDNVPHEREGQRPDFSEPPARKELPKELPKELQDTLDNEEKLWAALYEGK
jgi:fission process protein 1